MRLSPWAQMRGNLCGQLYSQSLAAPFLSDAEQLALARSAVNEGESPIVGAVNGFRRHFLEAHCLSADPGRLFVASTVGVSGQSIASLMDDTKYFNRVVECVTKAKAWLTAKENLFGYRNRFRSGTTRL